MKRLIAAICVLVIGFCAMSPSAVLAAEATEENGPQKLTVEEAAKLAIAYSNDLQKIIENDELNTLQLEELRQDYKNEIDSTKRMQISIQIMQLEAKIGVNYDSIENQKESLEYSITQVFSDIIAAQNELKLYDKNVEMEKEKLKIARIKIGLGMLSQYDYDALSSAYTKLLKERKTKEVAIGSAFDSLNKLMGKNLDTRYDLALEFKYETISQIDVQAFVSNALDKNASIKQKEADVKTAEYELQTNASYAAFENSETGSSKASYELKVVQAVRDYNNSVELLSQKARTAYNEITTLETQLETNRLELKELTKQLTIKRVQFDAGRLTQLDLDAHIYKISQMEETIRSQEYKHALKVIQLKNPNLL